MMLTVEDVRQAFVAYHQVHFNTQVSDLPALDLLIVHGAQHTEVVVGRRSLDYVFLIHKLLAQRSTAQGLTLILVVPHGPDDLGEHGFVKTPRGWMALC